MAKIPYLFRRNNIFYFRARIPFEYQKSFKTKEVVRSLKTENQAEVIPLALKLASNFKASFQDIEAGKIYISSYSQLIALLVADIASNSPQSKAISSSPVTIVSDPSPAYSTTQQTPLLSVVINEFLERYDPNKKATLNKLNATLPVFLELVSDKPINQILQADINAYFDDVQKLPVRRDAKIFRGVSLREIMIAITGKCQLSTITLLGAHAELSARAFLIMPFVFI